jgi:hypothetical protein
MMRFYDIEFINKNWFQTFLSGLGLGWLVDLKIANQSLLLMLKRMIKFIFAPTSLKALKEGEIRIISDCYVLANNYLTIYLKLDIPNILNYDDVTREDICRKLSILYDNITVLNRIEMVYFKRNASLDDYLPYVYWVNNNFKKNYFYKPQQNDRDRLLLSLENDLTDFLQTNRITVVDNYLMISTYCPSLKNAGMQKAKQKLNDDIGTYLPILASSGIKTRTVTKENLHEFLLNYVAGIDYKPEVITY